MPSITRPCGVPGALLITHNTRTEATHCEPGGDASDTRHTHRPFTMNQEGMTETHNTRTEATQYEPGGDASDTHTNTQRPLTMNQEGMPVTHTHTQIHRGHSL